MKSDSIILGIDPGTSIMGFGLIKVMDNQLNVIQFHELILKKYDDHYLKLEKIFNRTIEIIEEYYPNEIAIEAPFYGKNVQSMLKLGRAQGVAMAAVLIKDIPIQEYSPRKIKKSITGNGASSKEQVAQMLQTILKMKELPKLLDATDGLAAALCHFYQSNNIGGEKNYSNWKSFVNQNPKRIN